MTAEDRIGTASPGVAVRPGAEIRPVPVAGGRIADIEVLRAIAIIFVLIHHARGNLITWPTPVFDRLYSYLQFWPGVDLFFAISGFVIARSLVPALRRSENRTAFIKTTIAFWIRRAWRLLPSAWLWLALILIASAASGETGLFGSFRTNFEATIAAVLDVANFRLASCFMQYPCGSSFVYWSLSLEEQFYILLPIVILLAGRRLTVSIGIFVVVQFFIPRIAPILQMLRTDALLLGVLLAIWSSDATYRLCEPLVLKRSGLARWAVLIMLLAGIAALGSDDLHIVQFRYGMIALLSAVLVMIASYDQDYLWRDSQVKRVFIWIGSRSYGLYLMHVPLYYVTREIWYRIDGRLPSSRIDDLGILATAAALLLLLSEINFRVIEDPLRARGARIARRFSERPLHHSIAGITRTTDLLVK